MTKWVLAFVGALAFWLVYFYFVDLLLMEAQGLPVGWSLMPGS